MLIGLPWEDKMTTFVNLRANQATELSWNQVDSNFSTLAGAIDSVAAAVSAVGYQGGTTAQRPTTTTLPGVILYQSYFDTTLGFPIWCKQVSPSIIWVNAAGVVV